MTLTLCRAAWRLIELKALVASTRRAASVSGSWNILRIAWTAASHPPSWPAHSWSGPVQKGLLLLECAWQPGEWYQHSDHRTK